jgi:hypothetical protein
VALFPIIAGPHGRPGQRLGENVESRCPAGPPITHVGAGGSGDLVRVGMGPHTHRLAPLYAFELVLSIGRMRSWRRQERNADRPPADAI